MTIVKRKQTQKREVTCQGHAADECWNQNLHPGLSATKTATFPMTHSGAGRSLHCPRSLSFRTTATQAIVPDGPAWHPSGVLGQNKSNCRSTPHSSTGNQDLGIEPRMLCHQATTTHQLTLPCLRHPNFTCVLRFDVLLMFNGIGKGFVTGVALE